MELTSELLKVNTLTIAKTYSNNGSIVTPNKNVIRGARAKTGWDSVAHVGHCKGLQVGGYFIKYGFSTRLHVSKTTNLHTRGWGKLNLYKVLDWVSKSMYKAESCSWKRMPSAKMSSATVIFKLFPFKSLSASTSQREQVGPDTRLNRLPNLDSTVRTKQCYDWESQRHSQKRRHFSVSCWSPVWKIPQWAAWLPLVLTTELQCVLPSRRAGKKMATKESFKVVRLRSSHGTLLGAHPDGRVESSLDKNPEWYDCILLL